ncbi:acyltransferase family protein [Achromobacter xylosoxidans]
MGILRTLLALSVVLDHLGGGATNQLVGGRLAVQLFYVISGFLISYVLTGTDRYQGATGHFYANRLLRLFPVYLAVAALTLAAHAAGDGSFFRLYDDLPLSARLFLILSNLFIVGQDWLMFFGIEHSSLLFTGSFAHSDVPLYQGLLVPQAWTLGVEITFSLVAPFVLRSPRRLLALLAASLALRAVLIATGIGLSDPWTYRFFPAELALFLAGALSHQILLPRWQALTRRWPRLPELGVAITGGVLLRALFHRAEPQPARRAGGAAVRGAAAAGLPVSGAIPAGQGDWRTELPDLYLPCPGDPVLRLAARRRQRAPAGAFRCAGADRLHRLRGPAQRADRRSRRTLARPAARRRSGGPVRRSEARGKPTRRVAPAAREPIRRAP